MVILGLDTAGEQGSVGIIRDGQPLSEIVFPAAFMLSEKLLDAIEVALNLAEVKRGDLGLISVSLGPGSFTGLRIGIATAKGLARALEIPLVGVPAFDMYVQMAKFWKGPLCVLLPDRRDWMYYALYQDGRLVAPWQTTPLNALWQRLEGSNLKTLFIGPGAERQRENLARFPQALIAPVELNRPSGQRVAILGWERYCQGRRDELYELEPLYLQAPATEIPKEVKVP